MASIPINNLTNKTDINGAELLPFVRDGKTFRCSVSGLFYNDVITTLKIANSAVTTDKINNNAITTIKLASSAVTTDKIANGSVTPAKLSTAGPSWDSAGGTFTLSQRAVELGSGITADSTSFIDFHSSFPIIDNDARLIRDSGTNGSFRILNNGTGNILLSCGTGNISLAASGNVGIGTTAPGAKLEVIGGSVDDATPEFRLSGSSGDISTYVSLSTGFYNPITLNQDKGIIFTQGSVNTGNLVIAPWSNSIGGIRINSSGNVGIKKSSPTTALDVDGTVTATYVTLCSTPTNPSHATTKEYVDNITFGVSKFPEKSNSGMYCSWDSFCFIDTNNTARVIGDSNYKFSANNIYAPAQMVGSTNALYNVNKFYVNDQNSFVLTNEGNVFATGRNNVGQLGVGNTTDTSSFSQSVISNCSKVVITANGTPTTTYFLTTSGEVYATGDNQYGQLGRGNTTDTSTPILTLGPGNVYGNPTTTVIDVQNVGNWTGTYSVHSAIALLANGTVWCVGYGGLGQMGNGTSTDENDNWVQVKTTATTNLTGITNIYGGGYYGYTSFYALDSNSILYGWGSNDWGQLATGTTTDKTYATTISTDVSKFWIFGASCFLKKSTDNKIYAWGYNNYGSLGLGNTVDRTVIAQVPVLSSYNIENLWGSAYDTYPGMHVFAKNTGSNTIFSSGYNVHGALGIGNQTNQTRFKEVYFPITSPITDMICQYDNTAGTYTMILTQNGNIYHAGIARFGLGSPSNQERWLFGRVTNNVCG